MKRINVRDALWEGLYVTSLNMLVIDAVCVLMYLALR